jgi:TPR repeat protein
MLAGLLLQGEVTWEEAAEAVTLFAQAANAGHADAAYNLGVCFRRGIGVDVDRDKAHELYRAAAEKGHPSAQFALGSLLVELADEESLRQAARWYELAAAAGIPEAAFELASLYETGTGVQADLDKAIHFNTNAAQAGHTQARLALNRLSEARYGGNVG